MLLVSHIGYLHLLYVLRQGKGEIAVDIGGGTLASSYRHYCGSDQRLIVGRIYHGSAHRLRLGRKVPAEGDKRHHD
jgi:hypothetical protein